MPQAQTSHRLATTRDLKRAPSLVRRTGTVRAHYANGEGERKRKPNPKPKPYLQKQNPEESLLTKDNTKEEPATPAGTYAKC